MSVNTDNSLWRLATRDGTKVKLLKRSGSISRDSGTAVEEYILRSEDLMDFLITAIPKPVVAFGGVQYLARASFYGLPSLIVDEVKFESVTDSKPIDPFGSDPNAPGGTYEDYIKAIVTYRPRNHSNASADSDPSDPLSFLQVDCEVTGSMECENLDGHYYTYKSNYSTIKDEWELDNSSKGEIKTPDIPHTVISPVKTWHVTWPHVPYEFFYNTLAPKLDAAQGTVNSKSVEIFHGTKLPHTMLFTGYSTKEEVVWDTEDVRYPPISLGMQFMEKGFWSTSPDGPVFVTWSVFYIKGEGWKTVTDKNKNLLTHQTDHREIWSPE